MATGFGAGLASGLEAGINIRAKRQEMEYKKAEFDRDNNYRSELGSLAQKYFPAQSGTQDQPAAIPAPDNSVPAAQAPTDTTTDQQPTDVQQPAAVQQPASVQQPQDISGPDDISITPQQAEQLAQQYQAQQAIPAPANNNQSSDTNNAFDFSLSPDHAAQIAQHAPAVEAGLQTVADAHNPPENTDVAETKAPPITVNKPAATDATPQSSSPQTIPASTAPASPKQLGTSDKITLIAKDLHLDPVLAHAVIGRESGNNPAIGNSVDGAVGIAQIMPKTFNEINQKYYGGKLDINNPDHNLIAGLTYLRDRVQAQGGDPIKGAGAYFAGDKAIQQRRFGVKDGNGVTASQYMNGVTARYAALQKAGLPTGGATSVAPAQVQDTTGQQVQALLANQPTLNVGTEPLQNVQLKQSNLLDGSVTQADGSSVANLANFPSMQKMADFTRQAFLIDMKYGKVKPENLVDSVTKIATLQNEGLLDAFKIMAYTGNANAAAQAINSQGVIKIDPASLQAQQVTRNINGVSVPDIVFHATTVDGQPVNMSMMQLQQLSMGAEKGLDLFEKYQKTGATTQVELARAHQQNALNIKDQTQANVAALRLPSQIAQSTTKAQENLSAIPRNLASANQSNAKATETTTLLPARQQELQSRSQEESARAGEARAAIPLKQQQVAVEQQRLQLLQQQQKLQAQGGRKTVILNGNTLVDANTHQPIMTVTNELDQTTGQKTGKVVIQRYDGQAAPQQAAPASAPPATALKKGVNTTFANGQVWTMDANGKPQFVGNKK